MNEIPNLATPNDVLEHIPFMNANGEIEVGEVTRVNELDMPFVDEASDSKPGEFLAIRVPQTGYYTRSGYDLAIPYSLIAETIGVDIDALRNGHPADSSTINITGNGFNNYCYVKYNGIDHINGSFEAGNGDSITLYANFGPKNRITVNGEAVANGGPCTYELTVSKALNINLSYSPASHAYIDVTEA